MAPPRKILRTTDGLPVRSLRPKQAKEVYGWSADFLVKQAKRGKLTPARGHRMTLYKVDELEALFLEMQGKKQPDPAPAGE